MIKNIVFDLGGVIMTIDQSEAVRRFKSLGLEDAEKRLDPYTQSGIFGDLEEGKITAEDFRRELSSLVGKELTFEQCCYGWRGYCKEVPRRALYALKRLKADGYRLILLSNTNPYMMSWALSDDFDGEGHSLESYFESLYLSYKLKMMKPCEEIFNLILEKEGITPEETLFVDDGPRNTAMASNLGINTLCPKNGEDWTDALYERIKCVNEFR